MQIEIYNMIPVEDKLSITLEAICDSFSSLLWDVEYYSCGAFEVYIAASPQNIETFQTGRIVGRDDDKEHYGIIESVEIQTDAEDGDYLIVRGRFLMCLLERRIIYPTVNFTKETTYADIIKSVVLFNAVVSGVRRIPGLSVGISTGSCWEHKTKLQISYDNLMRWVYTICEKIGGTANIRLTKTTNEQYAMILELSQGSDRSIMQSENPHIVFSDGYNNLLSFSYSTDISVQKNFGICCNTGENYRKIEFEILAGTPATSPSIPRFKDTETKTYLTLCAIRIDAGATEIKVTDYRENTTYCGYVRCILGKCKVTDMMSQLDEITEQMKNYNTTILQLTNKVTELTAKVDEIMGDVVSVGKCGNNINYVLYSDGKLILKGTGAMFDYDSNLNASPFNDNQNITSVVVSEGITAVGEYAFQYCDNLKTATLPTTLKTIKRNGFMPHIDEYMVHQNLYGLTEITIPPKVTEIAKFAFSGTAIKSVTIPASVTTVGEQAFGECQKLETVRYSGKVISDRMFVRCIKLKNFTITKSTTEIVGGCFNYCESLTLITYEGTISEWNSITKHTNWDGHTVGTIETPLTKIQCLDGYMEYVDGEWREVHD